MGQTLTATFTPIDGVTYVSGGVVTVQINVLNCNAVAPTLTWQQPANICQVTPLSGTQLDASATDPVSHNPVTGYFTYDPPAGKVLNVGAGQTLTATFHTADPNYLSGGVVTTTITVVALCDTAFVSGGYNHTCALGTSNPSVQCWGDDSSGEADGSPSNADPGAVMTGPFSGLSAGVYHTCVLQGTVAPGRVLCWGDDKHGELNGIVAPGNHRPVGPAGLFVEVSAGRWHTCGILAANNRVECWGSNLSRQLGPAPCLVAGSKCLPPAVFGKFTQVAAAIPTPVVSSWVVVESSAGARTRITDWGTRGNLAATVCNPGVGFGLFLEDRRRLLSQLRNRPTRQETDQMLGR